MASESLQVRRRPTRVRLVDSLRDSNVVRASVLETALELGLGQNSTVAHWIFNNPLSEEPEGPYYEPGTRGEHDSKPEPALSGVEAITPSFTSGSNSISDESSSLNSPANNAPSAAVTTIQVHAHKQSITESPHVHFGDFSSDQLQLFSPFALTPRDAYQAETRGNSLGKFPGGTERSHSQDDSLRCVTTHQCPSPAFTDIGYTSEGQYLSKGKTGKEKNRSGKPKNSKSSKLQVLDIDETSERDGDYTSDGGYLSASSNKSQSKSPGKVKSRAMAFFRRRSKKTGRASDEEDEDSIPPVPAIPVLTRPSSPKPLGRRAAPSSPTRSGFSPLTLNLTSRPASPPRRPVSKSPSLVHTRAGPPQRSDHFTVPQRSTSPVPASMSAPIVMTPVPDAATFPLPPSVPGTPLSTTSPATSGTPPQLATGIGLAPKSLTTSSSRQHLNIPPPAPPPTHPLPQPPPSLSTLSNGVSPAFLANSTTPRRGTSTRLIPVVPTNLGSIRPLSPRGAASPFRPLISPAVGPASGMYIHNGGFLNGSGGDQPASREVTGRVRSGSALLTGSGTTPAFLQRKIQYGPPSRYSPLDEPLPPSPCPVPSMHPRTPIGSPSKFHEHLSSVSSMPMSQILSTTTSVSPSPSTATLSGSSSGPSVRSYASSASDRSGRLATQELSNIIEEYSRPTTSASTTSDLSYGQPITSTLGRPAMDIILRSSDQVDISLSTCSPTTHRDSSSVITYEDDDADVDNAASKSCIDEEDDDASVYSSENKTAGRRTMYLMEHGELDESGDEIVAIESCYWNRGVPPPLPPLPSMSTRPGPGYF